MPTSSDANVERGIIPVYAEPNALSQPVQRITDLSRVRVLSRMGNFTAIELAGGQRGFIASEFLHLHGELRMLKTDAVAMYQSASMQSPVRATLVKGTLLECIGCEIEAEGVKWTGVRSPHGQTGYIRGEVKLVKPSRLRWIRMLPRHAFLHVWVGACIFLLGVGVTYATHRFAVAIGGGLYLVFYGPMIGGFGEILLGLRQLSIAIDIERRRQRERLR